MKVIGTISKVLAVLIAVSACGYGGYLLFRGTDISVPPLFQPPPGKRLIMSMDGFRFIQSENGNVLWRVHAKNADLFENKDARLRDIEIVFQDPDGKTATLTGDVGTMDTADGDASIRRRTHDVRVVTSDGYLLTTNSLYWKAGQRLVWTADPFKLIGSEIYLEGVGVTANVDLRTIVVKEHVKAVLEE